MLLLCRPCKRSSRPLKGKKDIIYEGEKLQPDFFFGIAESHRSFLGLWQKQRCHICPPAPLPLLPAATNITHQSHIAQSSHCLTGEDQTDVIDLLLLLLPPRRQTVRGSGWLLPTGRTPRQKQRGCRPRPSCLRAEDCREKAPPWLLPAGNLRRRIKISECYAKRK